MFSGSMVAIVTPFKNGKLDETSLRRLIDRQIENGTQVIVPCGTTGESATLTHSEHDLVIQIRLHQSAKKIGADGSLQITPYYNKPTQEGLYQHFKAVAASSDLPIILYNVPGRTAVNMLPETVVRLSQIDTIVGIKEASGSLEQAKKIIDFCPQTFSLLSGEDAQTLDMLKLGAKGAISVTANVVPKECFLEWDYFQKGQIKKAEEMHQKLMPLHGAMFIETNPIPVKASLAMMGLIEEEYRLPLVGLSKSNRVKLQSVLKEYQLI